MRIKIVIFSLLILCFLAVPGSAVVEWQQSFESHPDDEDQDLITWGSWSLSADNLFVNTSHHGYHAYIYVTTNGYKPITFEKPFNDYLGFTISHKSNTAGKGYGVKITLKNSSSVTYFDNVIYTGSSASANIFNKRIELEEAAGGSGINVYLDGSFSSSYAYSSPSAADGTGNITISVYGDSPSDYSVKYGIDNIVSFSSGIIGCDNNFDIGDSYQYFKAGYPVLSDSYWFCNVYDKDNELVYTKNVSYSYEYGIPLSVLNESGIYTIRLYQHYNVTNGNYFFAERSFTCSVPAAGSISVNVTEAEFGDKIKITSVLNEYADDYTVRVTSSGTLLQTYEVDGEIKSYYYTIPETLTSNYLFVYLVDPDGDVVDFEQIKILNNAADPSLTLDKDTYTNNDTMYVYYYYIPIGTKLTATFYYNGDSVRSSTVTLNDVVGSEAFTIGGTVADLVFIEAYDDDTDEVYASATANILRGSYRISGKVYDAETGAPVSGATIISEGFSATTNSLGEYSANTFPGSINITVAATGYEDLHSAVYVTSVNTVKNFYLVPTSVSGTGSSLYGSVTDYYNGSALSGCYVRLQNGSVSYSALTTSKGYYSIEKSDLSGTWTVSVSKTGYDTYSSSVLISGDTYLGVRLVPTGGATADPDSTADDDDSSNTSTDRPGREAARESMEQFEALVPALIVLVVIKVIRELMK